MRSFLIAAFVVTSSAWADSPPPPPQCDCVAGEEVCWEYHQVCLALDELCATSTDCEPGWICDLRNAEGQVPGRCVLPVQACAGDADCAPGTLCAVDQNAPVCAGGDMDCLNGRGPTCGYPLLCEPDADQCGPHVCVQQRCTPPDRVADIQAIEADPARIADYRDRRQLDDDHVDCTVHPGNRRPAGWLGWMGLGLFALRRRSVH
jgi:MYXO-CTERM domain-containing protein